MDSSRPNRLAPFGVSRENAKEKAGPSFPQPPVKAGPADQDREYGCKLCNKKFSSKQALGGHQNAHKIERAMEKSAREMHHNYLGHFAGGSSYPGMSRVSPYLGSYNRSVFNNSPYHPSQQQGIQIGYDPSPGLAFGGHYPYGPALPRPVPRFSSVYAGWGAPGPRAPQFPGQGAYAQSHGLNIRSSAAGVGGSGSRPVYPNLSGFRETRTWPGGNRGGDGNRSETNNTRNYDQQDEESGLDLSLKL